MARIDSRRRGIGILVFPGLSSPPLISAVLMAAAGIAWGLYTLRGRTSEEPLADTTGNFIRSIPMVALAAVPFFHKFIFRIAGSSWRSCLARSRRELIHGLVLGVEISHVDASGGTATRRTGDRGN